MALKGLQLSNNTGVEVLGVWLGPWNQSHSDDQNALTANGD